MRIYRPAFIVFFSLLFIAGTAHSENLCTWLICGEFPNPAKEDSKIGFETDYLTAHGGEAEIRPSVGMAHQRPDGTKAEWSEYKSPDDIIDLAEIFADKGRETSNVVAYAFTTLKQDKAGGAFLVAGSDDGIKIWVNGVLVHENLVQRGVSAGSDILDIALKEGDNAILVKVEQGGGGWGFVLSMEKIFATTEFDLQSMQALVSLKTPADQIGKTASIAASGGTLVESKLEKDESGNITAELLIPMPSNGESYDKLTVMLDGEEVSTLNIPNLDELAQIGNILEQKEELIEKFGINRTWDDMAKAPPLIRRHRGMVARMLGFSDSERLPAGSAELSTIANAVEMLNALKNGEDYLGKQRNEFWSAYYSSADGSGQHFVTKIPEDFNPEKTYPLIVSLHGLGGRPRPNPDATYTEQCLEVQPWGRGDTWYAALGDNDVVDVIDYMKQWYNIDPDRVYVMGWSMGGRGTWTIASHHPDLFAAASPFYGWGDGLPIENLRNVPVFNQHGAVDWVVSIDQSRFTVDILQKLGYPVAHLEHPKAGHGIPDAYPVRDWMLSLKRQAHPAAITYTCQTPDTGKAYWLNIRKFVNPHEAAIVKTHITGKGEHQLLTLLLPNVAVLELDTSAMPVDLQSDLLVQLGQTFMKADSPLPEKLFAIRDGDTWSLKNQWSPPESKIRPYRAGSSANLYTGDPLMIVYGTKGGEGRTDLLHKAADQLSKYGGVNWREISIGQIPIKADTDVTDEDIRYCSLILLGSSHDNHLVEKMSDQLPFTINEKNELLAGDREPVSLDSGVIRMAYYNPLSPKRLIFLLALYGTDEDDIGGYLEGIQHVVSGLWGMAYGDLPDLVVQSLDGPDRRRMQFTHDWKWRRLPGADKRAPDSMSDYRQMEMAHLRVMHKTAGVDFALSGLSPWGNKVYDPKWFTLADMAISGSPGQIMLGSLSGQELIEIHQKWIAEGNMGTVPEFKPDDIDPECIYRIAISPGLCWDLMERHKNLRDVQAGPQWRARDLWDEVFKEDDKEGIEKAMSEELKYYAQQGPMTDPRQYADLFDSLPKEIPSLCEAIRGFLLHTFNAPHYGVELSEARKHREWDIRPVSEMLDQVFRLDDRPLLLARPAEKRLTGICRHFATILCSMLRHQGIPARARAGFVDYGKSKKYGEHWVCEYWNADQERWIMVDSGVDEYQREKMGIDPHDVTPEQFIVAGKAWQLCRTDKMEPEAFGIFDDVGMYMVRGNVVQDLASLNKVEALPWDLWGLNTKKKGETTSPEELALLDRIAEITLATDERFSELHSLYQSDDRLRAPSYLEDPMKDTNYGFRYDPMKWIDSNETLQGALVRTLALKKPHEGDQQLIDEAINKILAEQKDDGNFGEEGKESAGKICELIELGYPADKPEIQRAADSIIQLVEDKKTASRVFGDEGEELPMGIGIMRALCLTGRTDLPELHTTLQWYADNVDDWINRGCPWGQSQIMVALSAGRQVVDIEAGFNKALSWFADNINGAGCLSYFDPWSFVRLAGLVDHPLTKTIVEKQLTLILCSQYPDGGWDVPIRWATNQSSLNAFRALEKHGLLEDLSHRPPLPPGWEIAESIPVPEGDLWGLAWDGEKWWVCDDETHSAIAISPENGDIVKKVKIPEGNGRGFGWWNGAIAVNQGCPWKKDPKRLVKVDPDTGEILKEIPLDMLNHAGGVAQVNGNAWVVDSFFGWLMSLDASGNKVRSHVSLAGPLPVAITPDDGSLWHDDLWVPFFIKSGLDHDGQYIDSIEKPFQEPFAAKPYGGVTRGMEYDGENLWVLDNSNKRIVMLKKRGEK